MTHDAPDASCTSRYAGEVLLVSLNGRIAGTAGAVLLDWLPITRPGAGAHVVVNLGAVTSIDRAGADSLVDACLATALRHGTLSLASPTATVYDALRRFGVFRTVEVFADEHAALDAVAQRQGSAAGDPRAAGTPHTARDGDIIDRGPQGRQPDSAHDPADDQGSTSRVR